VKPEPSSSPSNPRPLGKKPQYDNAEKQQLSREGKCFIYKNPGHMARECPNRSRINEVDVVETPTSAPPASSNPRPTTSKRLPESNLPEPVKLNRGPQPRSILKKPSQSEASVDLTRPLGEIHPRKATVPTSVYIISIAPF
jgi:hypothetical protein